MGGGGGGGLLQKGCVILKCYPGVKGTKLHRIFSSMLRLYVDYFEKFMMNV